MASPPVATGRKQYCWADYRRGGTTRCQAVVPDEDSIGLCERHKAQFQAISRGEDAPDPPAFTPPSAPTPPPVPDDEDEPWQGAWWDTRPH